MSASSGADLLIAITVVEATSKSDTVLVGPVMFLSQMGSTMLVFGALSA